MTEEYIALLHDAYGKWGKNYQVMMALEEMAELSWELLQNINRKASNEQKIIDEIADVYIMLEQLKVIYRISDQDIHEFMKNKLERLKGRLYK